MIDAILFIKVVIILIGAGAVLYILWKALNNWRAANEELRYREGHAVHECQN